MGRYSSNPSYGHRITRTGPDDFTIYWTCDRYIKGSRQRHPTLSARMTDKRGAELFGKRWHVEVPALKCRQHPKYQAKRAPKAECFRCETMWAESQTKEFWSDYSSALAIPHSLANPVRR